MTTSPIATATPGEIVARAIAFGMLVVAGIAAIVLAGAWWAACVATVGLLLAVAGLIDVVFALVGGDPGRTPLGRPARRDRAGRAGCGGIRRRAGGELIDAVRDALTGRPLEPGTG